MKVLTNLLAGVLLFSSGCMALTAPTQPDPRETVARAVAASGGAERLRSLECCRMDTRGLLYRDGGSAPFTATTWEDLPNRMKQEMRLGTGAGEVRVVQVLNEQGAWEQANGRTVALPAELALAMRSTLNLSRVKHLYPLLSPPFTLGPLREALVQGRPARGVRASSPGQQDVALYFDRETGLLVKCVYREEGPENRGALREEYYQDYRDLNGIPWPMHKTTLVGGKKQAEREAVDFRPLRDIDPALFASP